jgi:hypothetical protein
LRWFPPVVVTAPVVSQPGKIPFGNRYDTIFSRVGNSASSVKSIDLLDLLLSYVTYVTKKLLFVTTKSPIYSTPSIIRLFLFSCFSTGSQTLRLFWRKSMQLGDVTSK